MFLVSDRTSDGVEIIEDDVQLAIREGGNHAVHEAEELERPSPLERSATIRSLATSSVQTRSWYRAAVIVAGPVKVCSVRELVASRRSNAWIEGFSSTQRRSPWQVSV